MQPSKSIFLNLLLLIVFSIGGIFIGFKVGWRIENPPPSPTHWEILDSSQLKFSEIIDFNAQRVVAQAMDGKRYLYSGIKWVQADTLPNGGIETEPLKKSKTCAGSDLEPPGKVVECAVEYIGGGPVPIPRYYALLEDGTIWTATCNFTGTDAPVLSMLICPSTGLGLGLSIAIFLIYLQNKNRKQVFQIVTNTILFIAFSVGGGYLGYQIGWGLENPSPESRPWKLITSPVKFSQISDVSSSGVWARSTNGKLYFWEFCYYFRDSATCTPWVEMKNIPSDAHQDDIGLVGRDCPESDISPKRVPGEIVECKSITVLNGGETLITYFALIKDGTIWYTSPSRGRGLSPFLSVYVFPPMGFGLGLFAGGFLIYSRMKKKKDAVSQT